MKKLAVILAASALLAPAAWAQVPPGLGAADPSQQLKTAGMNTFQSQATTLPREEKKEPLVSGTAEPGEKEAAAAGAEAPPAAPSTPAPEAPSRPAPVLERDANASANAWNPAASNTVAAPAGGAAGGTAGGTAYQQSAHMQRILDLVEQIRRRRDGH